MTTGSFKDIIILIKEAYNKYLYRNESVCCGH